MDEPIGDPAFRPEDPGVTGLRVARRIVTNVGLRVGTHFRLMAAR